MMAITAENTITCGLVKGYNEMPVDKYIFNEIESNCETINNSIVKFLINEVGIKRAYGYGINQNDCTDVDIYLGCKKLMVYIDRTSNATIAALIRACAINGVSLTLMHRDILSSEYLPQIIF